MLSITGCPDFGVSGAHSHECFLILQAPEAEHIHLQKEKVKDRPRTPGSPGQHLLFRKNSHQSCLHQ